MFHATSAQKGHLAPKTLLNNMFDRHKVRNECMAVMSVSK